MTEIRKYSTDGIMLALLLACQSLRMPQFITGCLVNSILVFAVLAVGWKHAAILSFLSPIGALVVGIIPSFMLPLCGVIAVGNLLMVSLYYLYKSSNCFKRIFIPSFIKACFISAACFLASKYFNFNNFANLGLASFAFLQFFTSIAGIAFANRTASNSQICLASAAQKDKLISE